MREVVCAAFVFVSFMLCVVRCRRVVGRVSVMISFCHSHISFFLFFFFVVFFRVTSSLVMLWCQRVPYSSRKQSVCAVSRAFCRSSLFVSFFSPNSFGSFRLSVVFTALTSPPSISSSLFVSSSAYGSHLSRPKPPAHYIRVRSSSAYTLSYSPKQKKIRSFFVHLFFIPLFLPLHIHFISFSPFFHFSRALSLSFSVTFFALIHLFVVVLCLRINFHRFIHFNPVSVPLCVCVDSPSLSTFPVSSPLSFLSCSYDPARNQLPPTNPTFDLTKLTVSLPISLFTASVSMQGNFFVHRCCPSPDAAEPAPNQQRDSLASE